MIRRDGHSEEGNEWYKKRWMDRRINGLFFMLIVRCGKIRRGNKAILGGNGQMRGN